MVLSADGTSLGEAFVHLHGPRAKMRLALAKDTAVMPVSGGRRAGRAAGEEGAHSWYWKLEVYGERGWRVEGHTLDCAQSLSMRSLAAASAVPYWRCCKVCWRRVAGAAGWPWRPLLLLPLLPLPPRALLALLLPRLLRAFRCRWDSCWYEPLAGLPGLLVQSGCCMQPC